MLLEQAVRESMLVLAAGDHARYRLFVFWQFQVVIICCLSSGAPSLAAYEKLGQTTPFYAVATLCAAYAVVFTTYFARRLG